MADMICFQVVKEPYGWAVRMNEGVMTPFQSRRSAIEHANGFADALRGRGENAEVVIEDVSMCERMADRRARRRLLPLLGLRRSTHAAEA